MRHDSPNDWSTALASGGRRVFAPPVTLFLVDAVVHLKPVRQFLGTFTCIFNFVLPPIAFHPQLDLLCHRTWIGHRKEDEGPHLSGRLTGHVAKIEEPVNW